MVCVPPPETECMFEQTVMPMFQKVYAEIWGDRAQMHVASSPANLAQQLEATGLRKSGLPLCCGVEWKYDRWEAQVAQKDSPGPHQTGVDEQEASDSLSPSARDRRRVHEALNHSVPKSRR
jgi:hypothetical protein